MVWSLSARRAWIEIEVKSFDRDYQPSLSARRAWIEIFWLFCHFNRCQSLSARRAWIEMLKDFCANVHLTVALRKESVDRNRPGAGSLITLGGSLSARRAWIEIVQCKL